MIKRKYKDISNQKFNYLTAIEHVGHSVWRCICECGKEKKVARYQLERSITQICGCQRSCLVSQARCKGKTYNKRLNKIFDGMKQRCRNPNSGSYKHYGARGIKICDEWSESYDNFYWWAMQNGYKEDLTIDRIDVDGDYEPSNCRWMPEAYQQRNKRNTVRVEINGELLTLPEIAEKYSINKKALSYRYYRGYRGKELISKSGDLRHNQKGGLKSID